MSVFLLEIVTPKGLYFSDNVESLSIKLTSGYRTFLKGHIPLIGALDYAPMHLIMNGKKIFYAVHGGAINVTKEKIIVITNAIERKEEIDISRAKNAKKRAEERLNSKDPNLDIKRARVALLRAIARIKTYEN